MLRFAPRYGIVSPALVRPSRLKQAQAVNDNGREDVAMLCDERVEAALRLFALHGLSAAEHAAAQASSADARGDAANATHWHEVCRVLDRRLAGALRQRRLHEMKDDATPQS